MFKYIIPTILLGTSAAGFYFFVNPLYKEVTTARSEIKYYNSSLQNSNTLKAEKEKLTSKYNSIKPEDLDRLQKMLPDGVDNVRLILEIGKIARPYGMVLRDIKYDSSTKNDTTSSAKNVDNVDNDTNKANPNLQKAGNPNYGVWNLEFSTQGSYANFLSFLKDLESNLRIVDISSIDFTVESPNAGSRSAVSAGTQSDFYKYNFKIKTYWLKN